MRLSILPDSLAGRTLLVLLVGLTVSHVAGTALFSADRHDAVVESGARLCADRVAVIARALDGMPAADRPGFLGRLASPMLAVSLSPEAVVAPGHPDHAAAAPIDAALRPYFGPLDSSRLHVAHRDAGPDPSADGLWRRVLDGFPRERVMAVSFRLSDGGWANFELAMAPASTLWSRHAVFSTLAMMASVVVFGILATRWIGRPLALFVVAADRLGRDVAAPPLDENGPEEVRRAVAAFNGMQERIRRFVEDRTRILAAISHDLRSPIARMRLRAELLPEGAARAKMLADLAEMEAMVGSTLDFARGEATDEPSRVIDLAATLAALCDATAELGLPADFAWDGRLLCTCRPGAIRRAMTNLVENAARYGGGRGWRRGGSATCWK
jgi:signal transduction histidine kinase